MKRRGRSIILVTAVSPYLEFPWQVYGAVNVAAGAPAVIIDVWLQRSFADGISRADIQTKLNLLLFKHTQVDKRVKHNVFRHVERIVGDIVKGISVYVHADTCIQTAKACKL